MIGDPVAGNSLLTAAAHLSDSGRIQEVIMRAVLYVCERFAYGQCPALRRPRIEPPPVERQVIALITTMPRHTSGVLY